MTGVDSRPATVTRSGLQVADLRRSYGDAPVLRGADLAVPDGALTALIGRSGSGKTTLLRLVAGFDRPDAGTIHIGGRNVAGIPPERRRIGYVTQEGNLFPHLTVAANITFGLPWRARRQRRGVAALLELVGLDGRYAARHPHELSGGEQQRVALARALAPRPDLVLLDEPFSSLDAELRQSTRQAVADALATTATTTVLVTHDQAEALSLADRVAVLRDGVIVQEGPPVEIYRHPVDLGVARFVGDVAELPAALHGEAADTVLGPVPLPEPAHGRGRVLVRPEQITLTEPERAAVTATVLHVDFRGHDGLVRVGLDEGDDGSEITARCPGQLLPPVGRRVGLRVSGTALGAFRQGAGQPESPGATRPVS